MKEYNIPCRVIRCRIEFNKSQKSQFDRDTGIDPELLWSLLWGNGYTIKYIGGLFGCGYITIREGMRKYGIPCPGYSHHDEEQLLETHCECTKRCTRRRRLKEQFLFEIFTKEEWLAKVEATKGICSTCGYSYDEGGGITVDHILPVSKAPIGFCYTIDDVVPMCRSCNSSKSDKV